MNEVQELYEIFQELQSTTSRNEKEAILFRDEKEDEVSKGCFAVLFEIKRVIC